MRAGTHRAPWGFESAWKRDSADRGRDHTADAGAKTNLSRSIFPERLIWCGPRGGPIDGPADRSPRRRGSSTMHVSRLNRLGRVLRRASSACHAPGPGRRPRPRAGRGRTGAEAAHPVPPRELADPRRPPDQRHPGAGPGRRRLSLARHRSRAGPLRRRRVPDLRSQQHPRAEGERRHRPVRRQRQPAVDRHRRRRRPAPARRRLRGVQPGPPVRLDQRVLPGSARRHLGRRRRFGRPGLRRTRWSSCAAASTPSRRFTRTRPASLTLGTYGPLGRIEDDTIRLDAGRPRGRPGGAATVRRHVVAGPAHRPAAHRRRASGPALHDRRRPAVARTSGR